MAAWSGKFRTLCRKWIERIRLTVVLAMELPDGRDRVPQRPLDLRCRGLGCHVAPSIYCKDFHFSICDCASTSPSATAPALLHLRLRQHASMLKWLCSLCATAKSSLYKLPFGPGGSFPTARSHYRSIIQPSKLAARRLCEMLGRTLTLIHDWVIASMRLPEHFLISDSNRSQQLYPAQSNVTTSLYLTSGDGFSTVYESGSGRSKCALGGARWWMSGSDAASCRVSRKAPRAPCVSAALLRPQD